MSVRAKFRVLSIERSESTRSYQDDEGSWHQEPHEIRTVKLVPVYSADPESENKKFWDATPSGSIELGCANVEAAGQFELGQEVYVDFTPVPTPEAES